MELKEIVKMLRDLREGAVIDGRRISSLSVLEVIEALEAQIAQPNPWPAAWDKLKEELIDEMTFVEETRPAVKNVLDVFIPDSQIIKCKTLRSVLRDMDRLEPRTPSQGKPNHQHPDFGQDF